MKLQRITLLAITLGLAGAPGVAQTPGNPPAENKIQAPATAQNPGMPRAAIATGAVDYVLPLEEIGPMLVRLTSDEPDETGAGRAAV